MPLRLELVERAWPMREPFAIARGVQTTQPTIIVTLIDSAGHQGRGEGCGVDYAGETPAVMMAQLEAIRDRIANGVQRSQLADLLPAGGARCALDAALWDLEARRRGRTVAEIAGIPPLQAVTTAYTIGIRSLASYEETARRYAAYPVLKIKVDGSDPVAAVAAVRRGAPAARLIIDANQSWSVEDLKAHAAALAGEGVVLLEQPVPVGAEAGLDGYRCPIPMAADELINGIDDLARARGRFDVINIKLDKTGGLTWALELAEAASVQGFGLMVGCMAGSSLSMAPALVLAQQCQFVDLDGPLLQSEDWPDGLHYDNGLVSPPDPSFWG
jgi:L-alanine-DL-glutamate epimerase-like enolase superfamily enzyme